MTSVPARDPEELDRSVRLRIYQHFAAPGKALTPTEMAALLGHARPTVEDSYQRLAAGRAIVLAPNTVNIWMAHPFSAVPTPYPVRTAQASYWANCAWDALNITALLGVDSETVTQCPDCAAPLTLRIAAGSPVSGEGVVHFAVPPRRFWENIGYT